MIVANGTFTDQHGKNRTFEVACEFGVIRNNLHPSERWICMIDNENPELITRNKDAEYTFPKNFPSIYETGKKIIQNAIEKEIEKHNRK